MVCQWWILEFAVGCESVNIGQDQPCKLVPAGILYDHKLHDFLVLCQMMLAWDLAKIQILSEGTVQLAFCFPQNCNFIDLYGGLYIMVVILFFFRHSCAYCYASTARLHNHHAEVKDFGFLELLFIFFPQNAWMLSLVIFWFSFSFKTQFSSHSSMSPLAFGKITPKCIWIEVY